MLGQKSFAVLDRLVLVKHRPGLSLLHHGPHELGSIGKVSLGLPELFRQRMETGGRSFGLGGELAVFADLILLHEFQRSGHLFEVIHLSPSLIGWAFPGTQTPLYIHDQISTPVHSGDPSVQLWQEALARNYIPELPEMKAFPEGGRAKPDCSLLPRHKERDRTARAELMKSQNLWEQSSEVEL